MENQKEIDEVFDTTIQAGWLQPNDDVALKYFELYPKNNSNEKVSNFWPLVKKSLDKIIILCIYFIGKR